MKQGGKMRTAMKPKSLVAAAPLAALVLLVVSATGSSPREPIPKPPAEDATLADAVAAIDAGISALSSSDGEEAKERFSDASRLLERLLPDQSRAFGSRLKASPSSSASQIESGPARNLLNLVGVLEGASGLAFVDWLELESVLEELSRTAQLAPCVAAFVEARRKWVTREISSGEAAVSIRRDIGDASKDIRALMKLLPDLHGRFPEDAISAKSESVIKLTRSVFEKYDSLTAAARETALAREAVSWLEAPMKEMACEMRNLAAALADRFDDPIWEHSIALLNLAKDLKSQEPHERKAIEEKLQYFQDNLHARKQLVEAENLLQQGRLDEALALLDDVRRYSMSGFYEQCLQKLDGVAADSREFASAMDAYAAGRPEDAVQRLRRLAKSRGITDLISKISDVSKYYSAAREALEAGNSQKAREESLRVLSVEKNRENVYAKGAIEILDEATARMQKEEAERMSSGLAKLQTGMYKEALEDFDAACAASVDPRAARSKAGINVSSHAERIMDEVKMSFWSVSVTEKEFHALSLLKNYLDPGSKISSEVDEFMKLGRIRGYFRE